MPRTIILSLASPSSTDHGRSEYWSVTEDGRICDGLCWDEMLGTVAQTTLNGPGAVRYSMRTVEEHGAHRAAQALTHSPAQKLEAALQTIVDAYNEQGSSMAGAVREAVKVLRDLPGITPF